MQSGRGPAGLGCRLGEAASSAGAGCSGGAVRSCMAPSPGNRPHLSVCAVRLRHALHVAAPGLVVRALDGPERHSVHGVRLLARPLHECEVPARVASQGCLPRHGQHPGAAWERGQQVHVASAPASGSGGGPAWRGSVHSRQGAEGDNERSLGCAHRCVTGWAGQSRCRLRCWMSPCRRAGRRVAEPQWLALAAAPGMLPSGTGRKSTSQEQAALSRVALQGGQRAERLAGQGRQPVLVPARLPVGSKGRGAEAPPTWNHSSSSFMAPSPASSRSKQR